VTDREQADQQKRMPGCPLIGLMADSQTRLEVASDLHRCWSDARPRDINRQFQSEICLGVDYVFCARYRRRFPSRSS
jgi:hypothetical protein